MLIALVVLFYPLTVTLALSTGLVEKLLASEDLKLEITGPAWSLVPGHVHLGGVRIYMNGETQFILSAEKIEAHIRLLQLVKRRFAVAAMKAENVSYQMRVQLDEPDAHSARAEAFPPLEGLPGDPTKSEDQAEQTEEREASWTVAMDGIDVGVRELWFLEYHYVGDGRLRGGFERGPDLMRVDTSVQDLGPGELRFGADRILSKNFKGQIEAEIPELDPSEHADASFFEFVNAKIRLSADLEALDPLSAYTPGVRLERGAGPLRIWIEMQKGALSKGTSITFSTPELLVKGDGFGVKTDWALDIGVRSSAEPSSDDARATADAAAPDANKGDAPPAGDELPRLLSRSDVTYVSFAGPGGGSFTIQIHGHEESATLNSPRIGGDTQVQAARVHLPKIVTEDLDDIGTFSSEEGKLSSRGGRAQASLTLDMDEEGRLKGPFRARFDEVTLDWPPFELATNGNARFSVALDPEADALTLGDFQLNLRDTLFRVGGRTIERWWLSFESKRIAVKGLPADNVTADLALAARDAEPVLRFLARDGKVPGVVADIVKLGNLRILAKLQKRGETIDITVDPMESNLIDFAGRIYRSPKTNRMALVVGGETISLGIDQKGEQTGFEAFAGTDWLNDQLSGFPPPRTKVSGDRP